MKYPPKISQLKIFQAIIKYGSIRGAARELNQSQPAVTRSLKELESCLGVTLMARSAKGITLTEAGQLFAIRMEVILSELQKASDELEYVKNSSGGKLRIGSSSLILLTIFPKMLAEFKKQNPLTNVYLEEGQISTLIPKLRENKLDFVIGTMSDNLPLLDFNEETLFEAPFTILCRKGHPLEHCQDINQLKDAKWVIPATDMGYYQQLQTLLGKIYAQLTITPLSTDSVACGLNLVLNSDYLIVIAKSMSKPLMLKEYLSEIELDIGLPKASYHLIYHRHTPLTPTANQMIKILKWHCQQTHWDESYTE